MRLSVPATALLVITLVPATALAQRRNSEVSGFGGLTFGTSALNTSSSSTFGGRAAIGLTGNIQAIVEGGRMTDIKPPLLDLLDFTPVGVRVTAWYGQGGVRVLASPRSPVRPYGEATAGFARLSTGVSGIGGTVGSIVGTGLNFLDRTDPMLGVGAGVLVQGGALTLDLGYRYNKILSGTSVASVLNGGRDFTVNQFRVGVGVRF